MTGGKTIASALSALAAGLALAAVGAVGGSDGNDAAAAANKSGRSGGLPQGSESVHLKPADFTTKIDNRYWPMRPGSRWIYRETDTEGTDQKVVIEVTNKTKMIANGIEARVVRDTVTEDGVPVEITDDWYAQDKRAGAGRHSRRRRRAIELARRRRPDVVPGRVD